MRAVRIWFSKTGEAKYISHLDLMRYITRMFRKTNIKPWYTEGFNPRLYMVFGLSLPLGVEGLSECFDIKLFGDETNDEVFDELSMISTDTIRFWSVTDPVHTPLDIAYAEYTVRISAPDSELTDYIKTRLGKQELTAIKKNKKGVVRKINLLEKLRNLTLEENSDEFSLSFILPAGNEENISPLLFLQTLFEDSVFDYRTANVSRTKLLLSDMENYS